MAKSFFISTAARDAACNAIVDLCDAGSGAATLKVYAGTVPATCATSITSQTLLGTLTFQDPAFGNSSTGTATRAGSITSDTSADASGTASFFRVLDSNGLVIMQGTAGVGATFNMNLDNATIVAGGTIAVSTMTVTVAEESTA